LLPALTGGNGVAEVEDFYEHHFIFNMPPDMELVPVNWIVGAEHIVEESVFRFTHTVELDWMLPVWRRPGGASRSRWCRS
jgi:carboxymethylenebutenolidase